MPDQMVAFVTHLFHKSELLSSSLTTITIYPLIQWN